MPDDVFAHINRGWVAPDIFAEGIDRDACGCTPLPCGYVSFKEANERECDQHSFIAARTIRSHHSEEACPTKEAPDAR